MEDSKDMLKLSHSSMETFLQCPRKYYYTYILKLERKEQPWFVLGTFTHSVLEKFHKYIMWHQKRNKKYDINKMMERAFMSALRKQKRIEKQGKMILTVQQKEDAKKMMASYLKNMKNDFPKVKYVEKPFTFTIDDKFYVRGFIDRVDEGPEVCDYKTSSKTYGADKNKQLDIYSYALRKIEKVNCDIKKKFLFLKHDVIEDGIYNDKKEKELEDFIRKTGNKILENMKSKDEKDWKIKKNNFCNFCDNRDRCDESCGILI
jgi:DNA helicase-2/ATP-dependent DNA helicase PcrA